MLTLFKPGVVLIKQKTLHFFFEIGVCCKIHLRQCTTSFKQIFSLPKSYIQYVDLNSSPPQLSYDLSMTPMNINMTLFDNFSYNLAFKFIS